MVFRRTIWKPPRHTLLGIRFCNHIIYFYGKDIFNSSRGLEFRVVILRPYEKINSKRIGRTSNLLSSTICKISECESALSRDNSLGKGT